MLRTAKNRASAFWASSSLAWISIMPIRTSAPKIFGFIRTPFKENAGALARPDVDPDRIIIFDSDLGDLRQIAQCIGNFGTQFSIPAKPGSTDTMQKTFAPGTQLAGSSYKAG